MFFLYIDQKGNTDECWNGNADIKYRIRDQSGQLLVSNLSCTNNAEAVLISNTEVTNINLEKLTETINNNVSITVRKRIVDKVDGTDEPVEESMSYDNSDYYWVKGVANTEGYFKITNPKSGKILTVDLGFKLQGKFAVDICSFLLLILNRNTFRSPIQTEAR